MSGRHSKPSRASTQFSQTMRSDPSSLEFRAFTGLTPTRYVEVRRRFLREHPGHALDGWPLPMVSDDLHSMSKSPYLLRRLRRRKVLINST